MSVLLETSLGDLVIDLDVDNCPKVCENFLKLSKTFYYTHNVFFSVQRGFLAQTGDPSATGSGGSCIWNQLQSSSRHRQTSRFFRPELKSSLKHRRRGTVSMALTAWRGEGHDDDLVAGSQFFITLDDGLDYLDGKHAPFGSVVEGDAPGDTIDKINAAFTDADGRPMQDIRIRHVEVLDDPFEDPEGLVIPTRAPTPPLGPSSSARLGDDEALEDTRTEAEKELDKRKTETKAAALTLEIVGDLPFAEVRPPENILFVCKLNPVTRGEDLRLLFGRFGDILSCEVIRDKKTGDSLQYAFIEFDKREAAEKAYFSMQNVLVDDRRIWVDFSQSVSNLHKNWLQTRAAGGRDSRHRPDSQDRNPDSQNRNWARARSRSPSAPHLRQSAHTWERDSGRRSHQRPREDDVHRDPPRHREGRHRREEDRNRDSHLWKYDQPHHDSNYTSDKQTDRDHGGSTGRERDR